MSPPILPQSLRFFHHLFIVVLLTILTQIGGLLYLLTQYTFRNASRLKKSKRIGLFVLCYLLCTYLVVPLVAPLFGRERIINTKIIRAQNLLYALANRNYVRPELNATLKSVASELDHLYPGTHVVYLDANFPFIDGFPLLPHLSHNDGRKLDITFVYTDANGTATNLKPSRSGYGVFEEAHGNERNQTNECKDNGYWQYDFSKYLTLGKTNSGLSLDEEKTKAIVNLIISQDQVGKLFIEPHLESRLNLTGNKIRFHGCQAVRHDDHIHFQLK